MMARVYAVLVIIATVLALGAVFYALSTPSLPPAPSGVKVISGCR